MTLTSASAPVLDGDINNGRGDFNGSSSTINCGDIDGMDGATNLTVTFWAYNRSSGFAPVFSKFEDNSNRTDIWLNGGGGRTYFITSDGGTQNGTTPQTALNEWHFYAMVYDGNGSGNAGRLHAYIDDGWRALSYNGTIPATLNDSANDLTIGNRTTFYADVIMDEINVFNRTLTSNEVISIYNSQTNLFF